MGDWSIVVFVLVGAAVGGLYGLIVALKSKKKKADERPVEKQEADR
ncbi:MAG: hypothetical protein FWE69_07935 [Clostridiales bacterium]|nr:hypothetical protein [Clostridiales bacterium]